MLNTKKTYKNWLYEIQYVYTLQTSIFDILPSFVSMYRSNVYIELTSVSSFSLNRASNSCLPLMTKKIETTSTKKHNIIHRKKSFTRLLRDYALIN